MSIRPGLCRSVKGRTEGENKRLRKKLKAAVRLKDWAVHTPTCSKRRGFRLPPWDCDCGFDEAMHRFEMAEKL